jgi:hypothetical protein
MARHQLGILFVHGTGPQPDACTLINGGEPLFRWLRAWLRARDPGSHATDHVQVMHATVALGSDGEPVGGPASFCGGMSDPRATGSWLVADHWWERPDPARDGALADFRETQARPGDHGLLARLRRRVGRVRGHELPRAELVERARCALRWLTSRCDTVAVIADALGAAVACQALGDADPPSVDLLLTFGVTDAGERPGQPGVAADRPGLQWIDIHSAHDPISLLGEDSGRGGRRARRGTGARTHAA